jgi:hypothetical protein
MLVRLGGQRSAPVAGTPQGAVECIHCTQKLLKYGGEALLSTHSDVYSGVTGGR